MNKRFTKLNQGDRADAWFLHASKGLTESDVHSLLATYGAACGLYGMATERYAASRSDADRADAQNAAHDAERARLDLLRAIGLNG